MNKWLPIEGSPTDTREIFIVKAFNVVWDEKGRTYTSDPYCVWAEGGMFVRWPHPFPPTHYTLLPEDPEE